MRLMDLTKRLSVGLSAAKKIKFGIGGLALLLSINGAFAQNATLRPLENWDEAREWWAVGRVNIGSQSFCTGTLIEVNVVLTAAHCFFNNRTGQRYPDTAIRFTAGYKDGSAQAIRGARKVVVDPEYDPLGGFGNWNISHDIAIFELDQPILESVIKPISVSGRKAGPGDPISIVSYGQGRSNRPSIQELCRIRDKVGTVLEINCDVTYGSSGAAVLETSNGSPRIISVISSGRRSRRYIEVYTPMLTDALAELMPQLSIGVQERKTTRHGETGFGQQLGRSDTGGLPSVSSGLPKTAGELPETKNGLPSVRSGLPRKSNGLPSIGD